MPAIPYKRGIEPGLRHPMLGESRTDIQIKVLVTVAVLAFRHALGKMVVHEDVLHFLVAEYSAWPPGLAR